MCAPVMAAASIASSLASTGFGAAGAINQGNAQAAAARYNAGITLMQGQAAADAARINEQQTYREGDQLLGRARAAAAANGVDVNSGSALQTQSDIGTRTGQNVANQQYNAQLALWGGANQAGLLSRQASLDQQAGQMEAAGTVLSGISQVSSKWAGFQQQGISGFQGPGSGW